MITALTSGVSPHWLGYLFCTPWRYLLWAWCSSIATSATIVHQVQRSTAASVQHQGQYLHDQDRNLLSLAGLNPDAGDTTGALQNSLLQQTAITVNNKIEKLVRKNRHTRLMYHRSSEKSFSRNDGPFVSGLDKALSSFYIESQAYYSGTHMHRCEVYHFNFLPSVLIVSIEPTSVMMKFAYTYRYSWKCLCHATDSSFQCHLSCASEEHLVRRWKVGFGWARCWVHPLTQADTRWNSGQVEAMILLPITLL